MTAASMSVGLDAPRQGGASQPLFCRGEAPMLEGTLQHRQHTVLTE